MKDPRNVRRFWLEGEIDLNQMRELDVDLVLREKLISGQIQPYLMQGITFNSANYSYKKLSISQEACA